LWLCLNFVVGAGATVPLYFNSSVLNYSIPGTPPPQIDAINFVNSNQFNVGFSELGVNAQFYEPNNTINYTNAPEANNNNNDTGIMTVDSPFQTNSLLIIDFNLVGVGFRFDTLTTNVIPHKEAGTFYNAGDIRCDSVIDGNNVFSFFGEEFFEQFNVGQCLIWATNIICPGNIDTSANGFINLTGQNVNLAGSVLTIETPLDELGLAGNASFTGTGVSGLNTNLWDPTVDLGINFADSSPFPIAPLQLILTNSSPYEENATVGVVDRSAFVQDTSGPNVSYKVWFGAPATITGSGEVAIGWAGTYLDFATGQMVTNYLYLNDDYLEGAITNVPVTVNGWPFNFTLTESATPLIAAAPSPTGFPTFPAGALTNNPYVYGDFVGSSTGSNPGDSVTNLTARIQITASQELNLSNAVISGPNYMSLTAPNEFDDNGGAGISSLYSDINLGRTNGSLVISNLLNSQIPDWSGLIQAWSTVWLSVETNIFTGLAETDSWRVVLVASQLNPVTVPQVRNMMLNATNSLVICDVLDVYGSFFANAQSLTLTTNTLGSGAESPDGELDFLSQNPFTWNWEASLPNLLWLTNNGAIRLPNFSTFIGSSQTNVITPGIPNTPATAILSETGGTNPVANSTVTVGLSPYVYVFVNKLTNTIPYQVKIGATFNGTMSNLIAAINVGGGAGTNYSTNTSPNSMATAGLLAGGAFTVSANTNNYPGPLGDGIPVGTTAANLLWSGSVLSGGANAVPGSTNVVSSQIPYGAFINNGLLLDQGSTIWANNFESGGVISNETGSFILTSQTTALTNGSIVAGGDVSISANTLVVSNLNLQAGRSLTLQVTNFLTDDGVTNGSIWSVGSTNGTGGTGLVLPLLPTNNTPGLNNLLGTTISVTVPAPNKTVSSTWAAKDYGVSTAGYTNNVAIGQLILSSLAPNSYLSFSGTGVGNAIYVDRLVLNNYASYVNGLGTKNIPTLLFNSNLVIYYADALASSSVSGGPLSDVSYQVNNSNNGHLRWVPQYMGYFSSTNMVYPNGTTNTLNTGVVLDPNLDSNGNGSPNPFDPEPIFVPSQVDFKFSFTNNPPPMSGVLTWDSIPSATNTIYYTTNMMAMSWVVVTNFVSPTNVPPVGGWPITNVVIEPLHPVPHGFYRVGVSPNSADVYGQ